MIATTIVVTILCTLFFQFLSLLWFAILILLFDYLETRLDGRSLIEVLYVPRKADLNEESYLDTE